MVDMVIIELSFIPVIGRVLKYWQFTKAKSCVCSFTRKYLNRFLPFHSLNQMYSALVRSHLDYCDVIYHIPPKIHPPPLGMSLHDHMEMIEKIQYQTALAVTGAWKGNSRVKLYEELG